MATVAPALPTRSLHEKLRAIWETPPGLYGILGTVDHKQIGKRYLVTAFAFLLLGGLEAAAMRAQLAGPDEHLLSPEAYNQLFSMHGITMIFLYASPILSGFSNYLWPLMLGSRDMAFPRLNALSYWLFLFSGIFIYSSVIVGQAPDRGWFAYAPMTEGAYSPGLNMDFYALGLIFLTVSTTVGAINFIVTLFKLRAPGMDDKDGSRTGVVQTLTSYTLAPIYSIGVGREGIFANITHTTYRIPRFQLRGEVRLNHSDVPFFETADGVSDWGVQYNLQLVATF